MMNKAVETLVAFIDNKIEPAFQKMGKLNWDEQENMGNILDFQF